MPPIKGNLRVDPLVRRLAARFRDEQWLAPDLPLLVSVSGGGDSMALLLALHALATEWKWRLEVFHAHHGIRAKRADAAAQMVEEIAAELQVPCHVRRFEIPPRAGRSFEEVARHARLEALVALSNERGIRHAVLGHTLDDLAETVLHRALRGTGLTGLSAIRPVTELHGLTLVRPLLGETRDMLRRFLSDHAVAWDEDETNADHLSLRNRIRHVVRPLLTREVNLRADEALARLAIHAAQDDAQLEEDVEAALGKKSIDLGSATSLPLEFLQSLSPSLQRRVLRRWLMARGDSPLPPTSRQVEETLDNLRLPKAPKRWNTFRGLILQVRAGALHCALPPRLEKLRWPQVEREHELGESVDLPNGWRMTTRIFDRPTSFTIARTHDQTIARLDANQLQLPLTIRPPRTGDRFQPLGLAYDKPLRHFLSNERIPRVARTHLPLVCDQQGIAWVAGARIADRVKITDHTERILEIEMHPPA